MKKILILACVAALLVCAVAANAYVLNFAVSPGNGGNLMLGTSANSASKWADNAGNVTQSWVAALNPAVPGELDKNLYISTATQWDLVVWTEDAKSSVTLTMWGSSVTDLAGQKWGVYNGATKIADYTWATTNPDKGAAATPLISVVLNTTGATLANPIALTFKQVPADPVTTPEPGSILALGSGLVGLVGFAIRRRK